MENVKELHNIVLKLKKILESVKDDQTYETLNDLISDYEDRLERAAQDFNAYFGQ